MQRARTIVDARHWLNADGLIPAEGPSRGPAIRMAQCIEAGGPLAHGQARATLVPCRRRPAAVACPGMLVVVKHEDDGIIAFCSVCEADEFVIYEWEDTLWAEGPQRPVDLGVDATSSVEAESDEPLRGELADRLERALRLLGSTMSVKQVVAVVAAVEHPAKVLQAIVDSTGRLPNKLALERFMPVLMDLWNATPRAELGGRAPEDVDAGRTPFRAGAKIGRNDPCPCGSGKKYKKCCLGAADEP